MAPRKAKPKQRKADDWQSAVTGFGVLGRDKRLGAQFYSNFVDQATAEDIWQGDDIAARIVETVPNEMTREGWDVRIEGDAEAAEEIEQKLRDLNAEYVLRQALCYRSAYGGAGVLLGVDDGARGQALREPLAVDRVNTFTHLTLFTPKELQARAWYNNPLAPKFGQVSHYLLTPQVANGVSTNEIHESRMLIFQGTSVSNGKALRGSGAGPGWGDSIFIRIMDIIRDFQSTWAGVNILLQDFAPPVLKIKGLAKLLASNTSGHSLAARAEALDQARSIARTTILDSEEEFSRQSVSVAGLAEVVEQLALRLAAAADMPVSLLMGQSPSGLNATGEANTKWFFDQVRAKQKFQLLHQLRKLVQLIMLSKDGPTNGVEPDNWSVTFRPLQQTTEKENAEIREIQSRVDATYITNQVVTSQEIAKSRFGGDEYSTATQIDVDLRDEMLADEELQENQLGVSVDEPAQGETVASGEAVAAAADTALNGAQVTSAVGIVSAVAAGQLPRESGLAMLESFFNLERAQAVKVMGSVGAGFTPDVTVTTGKEVSSEAPANAQEESEETDAE